jgi:hypothetical protein
MSMGVEDIYLENITRLNKAGWGRSLRGRVIRWL